LPPPSEDEIAAMIHEYRTRGGAVTKAAPVFLLPTLAAAPPSPSQPEPPTKPDRGQANHRAERN
jgi:hypothetical protein